MRTHTEEARKLQPDRLLIDRRHHKQDVTGARDKRTTFEEDCLSEQGQADVDTGELYAEFGVFPPFGNNEADILDLPEAAQNYVRNNMPPMQFQRDKLASCLRKLAELINPDYFTLLDVQAPAQSGGGNVRRLTSFVEFVMDRGNQDYWQMQIVDLLMHHMRLFIIHLPGDYLEERLNVAGGGHNLVVN